MSSVNDIDADTYQDNVLRIAKKINVLLNEVIDLKYRQFTEVELEKIEEKSKALLEEYLKLCLISDTQTLTRPDESEFQEQVSNPDFLFNDLFQENRKLRRILQQKKEAEELQILKRRFYAVTNTDTCMSYMKQMDLDAQGFLKRLQADKGKTNCNDLIKELQDPTKELQDLIEKITNCRSNTKKQVIIESVTGVLTLGTAAATGVVAAVGIAGRTASAVSSAFAPAASIDGCSKRSHVKTDRATRTSSAANVDNSVSEVAVISTTAAKTIRTTVNVGKVVITAGSAITEAINIGTAVTNAKPHTTNRNRFRHELFRTFQETYSTTQSQTDTDTQTNTRTMALIVYEKLINDEDVDC